MPKSTHIVDPAKVVRGDPPGLRRGGFGSLHLAYLSSRLRRQQAVRAWCRAAPPPSCLRKETCRVDDASLRANALKLSYHVSQDQLSRASEELRRKLSSAR